MYKYICELCSSEIERDNKIEMEVAFYKFGGCYQHRNLMICQKCQSKMLDLLNNNNVFKETK